MIKKFIASPIDSILNKKSKNAIENKAVAEAIEQIESDIARLEGLKASLSQYGSVKLSSATDVTDSTGLALPATEKNPSIEGSLANRIESLSKNWSLIFQTTESNGEGTIENFKNYNEFVILLSANGFVNSNYVTREILDLMSTYGIYGLFQSSYYYAQSSHAMCTFSINNNGNYGIAAGTAGNENGKIIIFAR